MTNERYYRQLGREEGLEEGRREGREEGRSEGAERMLVSALRQRSVTDVAQLLDLPVDYVQTIAVKNGITTK